MEPVPIDERTTAEPASNPPMKYNGRASVIARSVIAA